MKHILFLIALSTALSQPYCASAQFSLEAVTSYPFPSELQAASATPRIAWAINLQGKRNLYVAEGPDYKPRALTDYEEDDGQELTSVQLSPDGRRVIYVRGGEHGGSGGDVPVNPLSLTTMPNTAVWSIPFEGGEPKLLGEGDLPVISPDGSNVAFLQKGRVYLAAVDGSEKASALFEEKGRSSQLRWSPDGKALAFVSQRGTHSLIGIYRPTDRRLQWIDPGFGRDSDPVWSPDGKNIAFVRTPGRGGKPDSILTSKHRPWEIRVADVETGKGARRWKAPETLSGSVPTTHGGFNLHWGAGNRIAWLSYHDGWPHLYSMDAVKGEAQCLTPGNFMVEQIRLTPDGKQLIYSANTGPDRDDIDRRHIFRVPLNGGKPEMLSEGKGIEAYPVVTGDHQTVAFFSAGPKQPALLAVKNLERKDRSFRVVSKALLPKNFPQEQLIVPKAVRFKSSDGLQLYAQLFEPTGGEKKKPAIVFVHGGPQRQMLLGWSYMDYYANNYAVNQYLASKGFVVLSINYRLGIGYGYDFHKSPHSGSTGADEYLDVLAAGKWLVGQDFVDPQRIGIYGGSYGGFLTAMGLAKNSDLFKAGVDIHGVHKWQRDIASSGPEPAPDAQEAEKVLMESSPVHYIDGWKSPVLLIHGDDDRNVPFAQTVDLVNRLMDAGVEFEELSIPDDSHHWMRYDNINRVNQATVEFLERKLKNNP